MQKNKIPLIAFPSIYSKYHEGLTKKLGTEDPAWFMAWEMYFHAVENAGGALLVINYTEKKEVINRLYDLCDGILFPGGLDIDPELYKEKRNFDLVKTIDKARDILEPYLFKKALADKKPCLGICRGIQLFNVVEGGTLYQDIVSELKVTNHASNPVRYPWHDDSPQTKVNVVSNTKLYKIVGESCVLNCAHHQAVKDLATGYIISAKSEEGIVEAIEKDTDNHWVLGLQGHPEATYKREECVKIFREFVLQCSNYHNR